MPTADVVIIGGGANGTSTAFHLATLGVRRVVLLERRHLAAGATGKSGTLVRMHYTNEPESRLAWESLKVFRDFHHVVGGECGFEATGFIQIVPVGYEAALRRNVERQRGLGIDTRVISREEIRAVIPGAYLDDVGAAAYEPGSGYADPNATAFAFAAAAERLGARIETHREATRVVTERDRVVAVETGAGRIDTPVVVLVPGAWDRSCSSRSAWSSVSSPIASRCRSSAGRRGGRAAIRWSSTRAIRPGIGPKARAPR